MDLSTNITIKNADLDKPEIRNKIFKYLRQRVDTHIKTETITSLSDLDTIRNEDYIICPRFKGTRSWIMFFCDGSNYYAVNFPVGPRGLDAKIFPVDMTGAPEIYNGTIMEGIFYKMDEEYYLVVDEVYFLAGRDLLLKPKDDRLNCLTSSFEKFVMRNKFRLHVSQFYTTNSDSLTELYNKIRLDSKIQELVFYPKIYGRKVYKYAILESDRIADVINLAKFDMHLTNNPDVYNLVHFGSGEKAGIAYVPDISTSKKCKQWFKNKSTKKLIVICKLHLEKNRWIPVELGDGDDKDDS
jgi:hypothetical protein